MATFSNCANSILRKSPKNTQKSYTFFRIRLSKVGFSNRIRPQNRIRFSTSQSYTFLAKNQVALWKYQFFYKKAYTKRSLTAKSYTLARIRRLVYENSLTRKRIHDVRTYGLKNTYTETVYALFKMRQKKRIRNPFQKPYTFCMIEMRIRSKLSYISTYLDCMMLVV